ncbi:GNAT family N-acetyltransferase [Allomuricauda sp. SCSIO 65647]|uniref:GNAT family N-acetyltransferase n=1 Tax=Allomuricauda sp. SCSIO 65647 TaxID=2908843 RepID=UPI001F202EDA|nr:GNAT family N-acetyltransferase [Muricauda sp. SCSIO 65647]UJH67735.1 GNAT family N-acetyltransferase [Muricauda sp. SCSIO 65647]
MSLDLQPILENELVKIRPLAVPDFDKLYEVAIDPLIWEQHQCKDRWKKDVFQEFFAEAIDSKGALIITDKHTGSIIGSSRYKLCDKDQTTIEIGWTFLSRNYWGGTYNHSIKMLMMAHAFTYFDNVLFYIDKDNLRSQKATEKLGGQKIYQSDENGHLCHDDENALTYCLNKTSFLNGQV